MNPSAMLTPAQQEERVVPSPGLYPGVDFEDYLRWPLLSQSVLKHGRESMAHLKAAIDGARTVKITDDMTLGSALHTAFLEPELAARRIAVWEGERRAGKAWDEFCMENVGRYKLTLNMHERLIGMVRSLRAHPVVREWLGKIEATEMSGIGTIRDVPIKGRCDAVTPDPLVDLKKVSCGDLHAITRTILDFGYHLQGYIYRRIFDRERFMLITVEDAPPYDVVACEMSPAMLREGEREVLRLLDQYRWCRDRNEWPGRSNEIVQIELPEWLLELDEHEQVTFGGKPLVGTEN